MTSRTPQPHDLPPDRPLFRLYRRTLDNGSPGNPLWFCPGETNPAESCRFDLHHAGPGRAGPGTCYTAEEATTAFLEAFKNTCGVGVPDKTEIDKKRLANLTVKASRQLVDLNEPANDGLMGITNALIIETTESYPLSHTFAGEAYDADFQGVRWKSLRDPTYQGRNCALFSDTSGLDPHGIFNPPKTQDIPDGLVKAVEVTIRRSQLRSAEEYPL